ncbi:MAG: hypothetical protein M5U26_18260 [Planctomycetota bacterium]|nr:hypothetical protein [Planctomycetota bacterium]
MLSLFRPPGGGISLVAILWILAGGFCMYLGLRSGLNYILGMGLAFFVLGAGLWLRQGWARWLAMGVSALGVCSSIIMLATKGWEARPVLKLLSALFFIHALWVWEVRKDDPEPEMFLEDLER